MREARLLVVAATIVFGGPTLASAAPTAVFVGSPAIGGPGGLLPWPGHVCVDTDTAAPVSFTLVNVDGQPIAATEGTALVAADGTPMTCSRQPGNGWSIRLPELTGGPDPAGGALVMGQAGVSVTVPLPYAAYAQAGSGPWTLHLRGLPNLTVARLFESQGTADGGDDVSVGPPLQAPGGSLDLPLPPPGADPILRTLSAPPLLSSTGTRVAFEARLGPVHIAARVAGRNIELVGADPQGARASATLLGPDGTRLEHIALEPRVGLGLTAAGTLFRRPAPGQVVTVSQPGWAERSVTAAAILLRPDGFVATAPPGTTAPGPPSVSLAFSPGLSPCRDFAATLSCTVSGQFVVPGDRVGVAVATATGDTFAVTAMAPGSTGSLDDGSYLYHGAAIPGGSTPAVGSIDVMNPQPGAAHPYTEERDLIQPDVNGLVDPRSLGFITTHVNPAATVTPHGPAFMVGNALAPRFQWYLVYALNGTTLSGTTYRGGRLLVTHSHGDGGAASRYLPAVDQNGNWSLTLADLRTGDPIDLVAANPSTHDTTTSHYLVGQAPPAIAGVSDGQAVRGTVGLSVSGGPFTAVAWGGDVAPLASATAPFPYVLDTRGYDDGPYLVEATALAPAPSAADYVYVEIDNTPPSGSLGPPKVVRMRRPLAFPTHVRDDGSGVASLRVRFGDGRGTHRTADSVDVPLRHVYRRAGRYRVTLAIADAAGNVRTSVTTVRVVAAPARASR